MMECKKALTEANGDIESAIKFLREKGLAKASKKSERETNEGKVFVSISENNQDSVILELSCETDFVANNDDFQLLGNDLATFIISNKIKTVEELEKQTIDGKTYQEYVAEKVLKLGENIKVNRFQILEAQNFISQYIHMNGKIGVVAAFDNNIDAETAKGVCMHIAASNPSYVNKDSVPTAEVDNEKDIIRKQLQKENKPENIIENIVNGKISKFYKETCLVEQEYIKDPEKTIQQVCGNTNITNFIRYSLG